MIDKGFILAGNATFTVEIPEAFQKGKAHYTFNVKKSEASERWPNESWFITMLTGPDNTNDYTYLGLLLPTIGKVILTKKSQFPGSSYPVKLLTRLLACLWEDSNNLFEDLGFKLHHEGSCGRCGRVLTTPESVERGIGPECWKIMQGEE